jgi:hypothetical protein
MLLYLARWRPLPVQKEDVHGDLAQDQHQHVHQLEGEGGDDVVLDEALLVPGGRASSFQYQTTYETKYQHKPHSDYGTISADCFKS